MLTNVLIAGTGDNGNTSDRLHLLVGDDRVLRDALD